MGKVDCSRKLDLRVMPSMCDENSLMSIPAMLDMFQDSAGIHAESVGMGAFDLEKMGLFWIVSKTRLVVNSRPLVQEMVEATTWIQPAERVSCERDWALLRDGEQLAYVKSIWAALRRDNFRPGRLADFYPDSDFSIAPPDDKVHDTLRGHRQRRAHEQCELRKSDAGMLHLLAACGNEYQGTRHAVPSAVL